MQEVRIYSIIYITIYQILIARQNLSQLKILVSEKQCLKPSLKYYNKKQTARGI
jgi:hypothetical protein